MLQLEGTASAAERTATNGVLDDLDDEDEIIQDPYFATILNDDREIVISDTVFRYTAFGILFALQRDYDALLSASRNLNKDMFAKYESGRVYTLGDGVSYLLPKHPSEDDNVTTGRAPAPSAFRTCDEIHKSFWEKIFGQSGDCEDYFDSRHRIKTKVWNQNFYVYSSIGVSVKSQQRFLRIWWADDTDEVEVGYNYATFKFPKLSGNFQRYQFDYYYQVNGQTVNQFGQLSTDNPANLFTNFPIKSADKSYVKICVGNAKFSKTYNLTGADLNAYVKSLVKGAWSALSSYGQQLNTKGVVIVNYDNLTPDQAEIYFTHANWFRNNANDNAIVEVFDWNTGQIGITLLGKGSVTLKETSMSYEQAKILAYGAGRRGGTWRGANVNFINSK